MSRPVRMVVLGGRGWLGRAVVWAAEGAGFDVDIASRTAGRSVLVIDPTRPAAFERALADAEVVVNAAGYRGDDPVRAVETNVSLPDQLGRLASKHGWRLLHLGSAAEYGPVWQDESSGDDPSRTDDRIGEDHPCMPLSLYGRTKLAGTRAVLRWRDDGAPTVVARVFNVAAADLPSDNPLHDIVRRVHVAAGSGYVGIGDPTTVRDISPRWWIAGAVAALAATPASFQQPIVNVCSGVGISFGDLAHALAAHLGNEIALRDLGWDRGGRIVGEPRLIRSLVDPPYGYPESTPDHLRRLVTSIIEPEPTSVALPGEQPCHHP